MKKENNTIIIRISDELLNQYKELLDLNGMNLSKRIKLLISNDIKKLNEEK